jgi:hypothetical protein
MAGWSPELRDRVEISFYKFLKNCFVNSKDKGRIALGDHLYDGQVKFITTVFDALEEDIHKIFVLKSRQLGLSTISRALSIFYLGIHEGLKGALVFDTSPHRESARKELVTMIKNLPKSLRFPAIQGTGSGNRESVSLVTETTMLFMSAGVKQSKSSGTLGRSEGLTMAHLSELCSYDNTEGLKSFEQSLSEEHPNRLYIYESTARGFNEWKQMWDTAKADPRHCKCLFLGWWSKPSQAIAQDHPDFELYGLDPPTADEKKRIAEVREMYGHEVTVEQLAWIRRKLHPATETEEFNDEDDSVMLAEQAWTETEAFQNSGAVFFASKDLTDLTNKYVQRKSTNYMFMPGEEFHAMRIYRADNPRSIELKVWEEPHPEGIYVLGIDPAYGENEDNCRSAIQVLRCYADGLDQVAEYAWPLMTTRHLAWVLAAILGWYGGSPRAEARYILELNGPGTATFNEVRNLKFQIDNAEYMRRDIAEKGLEDVFRNVRTYIYTRPDSMGAGYNWHWQTTTRLKITIMEQLRDIASNGKLRIRSMETIDEMRSIAREGDSIGAPGSMKDDRVIALALATYYWSSKIRNGLITQRRTRAAEEARSHLSIVDQVTLFNQNSLEQMFAQKRQVRNQLQLAQTRHAWRNGSGRRY